MKRAVVWALAFGCLIFDPDAHAADPKRVVLLALALMLAAAAAATPPARGTDNRRALPTTAQYTLLGFALLSGLSAVRGGDFRDLAMFTAAVGVARSIGGALRARGVARTIALLAGGGASLMALAAFVAGGHGFALHGGQGNPNWLGLLLAVSLPLSLEAVLMQGARGRSPLLVATLAAVQVPGLLLAHSRVAWFAVAASLAVAGVVFVKRSSFWSRRRLRGMRAALVALGLGAALAFTVTVRERALAPSAAPGATKMVAHDLEDRTPDDVSAARSLAGRAWIWRISGSAALDAPFFGAGLGRFSERYLRAQGEALRTLPAREASRRFVNATTAHDEPLQVAIESGVLAAVLLLLGLSALVVGHLRAGRAGSGGAALAVLITSLADNPLRQPAIVLLVALLVAAENRPRRVRDAIASSPAFARARTALAALGILGGGWLLRDATRGWLGAHLATTASDLANPDARARRLGHALQIDPSSDEIRLALATNALAAGAPELALTHLEAARSQSVGTLSAIGEAWLALGDAQRAADAWNAALALHPGSARAHLGLAEAERRLGHDDRAEASLRVAKLVLPGDPRVAAMADRLAEARSDGARPP